MKSRIKKSEELKSLVEKLPKSKIAVITSFARSGEKGLSVAQMTELKRVLHGADGEYFVMKKTLMDLAFKKLGQNEANVFGVDGSVGVALGTGDPYGFAKKIYDFAKKNPALKFFSALMDGQILSNEAFLEMAKMPSREQLIARLVGMLKYSITSLYLVMSEIAKKREATAS